MLDAINNADNQGSELGQILLVGSGLMSKGKSIIESTHGIVSTEIPIFIDSGYS